MASTTTSDSEDFESADEDISEESVVKVPVPSLRTNCQREIDKQRQQKSSVDKVTEPPAERLEQKKLEPTEPQADLTSQANKPTSETSPIAETFSSEKTETGQTANCEPPIERRRRQQKQREPKGSAALKKLGTKITTSEPSSDQSKSQNKQVLQNAETSPTSPDPYAKFRGYSKPPMMQRCWEINPDGKAVLDDHVDKVALHDDVKSNTTTEIKPEESSENIQADHDPYAKFRGFSEPPIREQCWEDDVDGEEISGGDNSASSTVESKNLISIVDKLAQSSLDKPASSSSWGGWGNWGVSSLLSSATEGVSTLTSHVTSVLESGIGAPNPEEMARLDRLEEKLLEEMKLPDAPQETNVVEEQGVGRFGFSQLMTSVSTITKLVETTGSKVLSGGLDTLETIGKKTMEVLQEGDPGLKKKRAIFNNKTVLSQMLREAKDKAEMEDKELEDKEAKRNVHFETLFDDFQGLVHLEALEMLSKQCDIKLQSLLLAHSGQLLTELQGKLLAIKDLCQLPDDEDIVEDEEDQSPTWEEKLSVAEKTLGVQLSTSKLAIIWKETINWLRQHRNPKEGGEEEEEKVPAIQDIHQKAVSTLARLTATSVEQFHKGAELLLVKDKRDATSEAEALISITSVMCCQTSLAATRFCELLNETKQSSESEAVNSLITNVFLEASNSSSYIQEAFQLLVPILQVGVSS